MTEMIAWAAGLYEGEGHITFSPRANGSIWRIAVTSTDLDVLEKFKHVVGVGYINRRRDRPGHKPCFVWMTARADDIWLVIEMLWPFLGSRRQDQIIDSIIRRDEKLALKKSTCKECGCHYDERVEGCATCYQRHYSRATAT